MGNKLKSISIDTLISYSSGISIFILIFSGYAISFNALREVGIIYGGLPDSYLSYLFPIIIDVFITACVLQILWFETVGLSDWKDTLRPRAAVWVFTTISILLNGLHTWDNGLIAASIAAIAPLGIWSSVEIFMAQIREIVRRSSTIKSINELLDKDAGLKTKVTLLAQELNGMETDRQNHDKFIKVAAKEKLRYEEIMATLKDEIYKNEALKKSLSIEVAQLNKDKSILQNWFKALSSSDAQSKKTRSEVKHRRAEIVKEIVKNGASANIVNNDMNIIEAKVNSNGYA